MILVRALPSRATLCALTLLAGCGIFDSDPSKEPTVAHVEVDPPARTLSVGDTLTLAAHVVDADGRTLAGSEVAWASSRPDQVAVDSTGRVRALAVTPVSGATLDSVRVTATVGGVTAGATFRVYPVATSLSVDLPARVREGRSVTFGTRIAYGSFEIPSQYAPTLTSSDTMVFALDGVAGGRAKRAGTADVTIVYGALRQTARVAVVRGGYTLAYLGTFGADSAWATDINDAGQVTVNARKSGAPGTAWVWRNGIATPLSWTGSAQANAINTTGEVAGAVADSGGIPRAAVFRSGVWSLITGLPPSPTLGSAATAINDSGEAVGACESSCAFRSTAGVATVFSAGGSVYPLLYSVVVGGINASGTAVGGAVDGGAGIARALAWTGRDVRSLLLFHASGVATAITDGGRIVGFGSNGSRPVTCPAVTTCAFVVSGDSSYILPGPQRTYAYDANERGATVGAGSAMEGVSPRGFIWEGRLRSGLTELLADDGWIVTEARGINESGQIAGYGVNSRDGRRGPVVLTPVP